MRMSAVARHRNTMPKANSKAQIEKNKKENERYRPRLCCKKCKDAKTTLYRYTNDYYCKNCIPKEEK